MTKIFISLLYEWMQNIYCFYRKFAKRSQIMLADANFTQTIYQYFENQQQNFTNIKIKCTIDMDIFKRIYSSFWAVFFSKLGTKKVNTRLVKIKRILKGELKGILKFRSLNNDNCL